MNEEDRVVEKRYESSTCTGLAMEAYEDTLKIMNKIRYQI